MRLLFPVLILCAPLAGFLSPLPRAHAQQSQDDQQAFASARAIADPKQRIEALSAFLQQFPSSSSAERASELELETYLQFFPSDTGAIHALAAAEINRSDAGIERWLEQARIANLLAAAGPSGADLADARHWAEASVAAMQRQAYSQQMTAVQARYKLPRLTSSELQEAFTKDRATCLAALAHVELRGGETEAPTSLLAEAARRNPLSGEISSLQGQLALKLHHEASALAYFERAEALGALDPPLEPVMLQLYKQTATGPHTTGVSTEAQAGLEREIDRVYNGLYPKVFSLPKRELPQGGHTVLLELFTGSGCTPCIAPDLAIESLLGSYTRHDLLVLEYDEHIPRPDPLANPDSVARAARYGVASTPAVFLDGESMPVLGSGRSDVENIVLSLADEIEDRASEPSSLPLRLSVTRQPDGHIKAMAFVSANPARSNEVPLAPAANPQRTLRFALVEDHIRYTGENGIRFHRMVVRDISGNGPEPYAVAPASPSVFSTSFDPAAISRTLATYLSDFEANKGRFGEVHLRARPVTLDPSQLAVVAWVEDAHSHAVVESAYSPVPSE